MGEVFQCVPHDLTAGSGSRDLKETRGMTIRSLSAAVPTLKRKHGWNPPRNPSTALPPANTTTIAVVAEAFTGKKLLTQKHKTAEIQLT